MAALLLLFAAPAWAQTSNVAVTYQSWSDLGPGPLLIVSRGSGRAVYAISKTGAPALAPELGFPVGVDRPNYVNTQTQDHIWARALSSIPVSVTLSTDVLGP